MDKIKKFIAEREKDNEGYKEYSLTIEPMYIGLKKDKRLERVMTVNKLNGNGKYDRYQAIVPKRSRLDQEVDKILNSLTTKKDE